MRDTHDHDHPPADWSIDGLAAALDAHDEYPLPRRGDRESWRSLAGDGTTGGLADQLVEEAAEALDEPMPDHRASVVRKYAAGDDDARIAYLNGYTTHFMRLTTFTLAECLEAEGRFLDAALDYAWDLCETARWTNPSNLGDGSDAELAGNLPRAGLDPGQRFVDLRSRIGLALAEVRHLLGDALEEGLRERIAREVRRRVVEPYEAREDYWWHDPPTNNWNAVCNTACAGSALYLVEDPERLARIVRKAARSLEAYLAGFDGDGGTAEGVGYWNFGWGYYTQLASLLEARTGGEYSLYDVPVAAEVVQFPLRAQLSPGRYPAFSDSTEEGYVNPYVPCWAGRRFGDDDLLALGRWALEDGRQRDADLWRNEDLNITARNLLWSVGLPEERLPTPPERTYFEGIEWWIARGDPADPDAPAVAAKAGDNAESHNHNDCGSFIYHCRGESLLADLGAPQYLEGYFEPGQRYEFLASRSLGHSVPHVNGVEQASPTERDDRDPAGEDGAAAVLDRGEGDPETFAVDLARCYPETAGLESLVRRFRFSRSQGGTLAVRDRAAFADGVENPSIESVLISYFPMEVVDGAVVITGNEGHATVDVGGAASPSVEHLPEAMPAVTADRYWDHEDRDVWRARLGPVGSDDDGVAMIEFEVTPGPGDDPSG
ncbi:MAG: heparinase [Halobacteriales archaeon]